MLASFTPEQLDRYECFRRSVLPRPSVRRLASATAGVALREAPLIVVAGLAKTFVGELVEEGLRVARERGDSAPLRPSHLQEAHRRLAARGKVFAAARAPSAMGGRGAAARVRRG